MSCAEKVAKVWGAALLGSQTLANFDASLIVVSDIHLFSPDDEKGRLLLDVLERVAESPVAYLVLLGDIFDFCLGSHPYFQNKFAPLGVALEKVVQSGTHVIYVEGNHEFRMVDMPWKGVIFVENGTHLITLHSGEKVQLAHGDMIYSHRRYKAFRWLVKSALITGIARQLPGAWMDRFATKGSKVSRAADQYRLIQHDRILSALDSWLEKGQGDFGICGHFHVPYAEPRRDGRKGALLSVDCWDKPNLLAFRNGEFFRMDLTSLDQLNWYPAQPLFRSKFLQVSASK